MMDKGRWRCLLAVSTFALLAGCDWFGGGSPVGKARPGVDRQIAPTGTLPSASPGHAVEPGVSPVDETRGSTPQIGSVVAAKGGQRAQKEAAEKDAAERDAKAREEQAAKDAADREARTKQQSAPSQTTPTDSAPGLPPADAPTPLAPAPPEPAPTAPKS